MIHCQLSSVCKTCSHQTGHHGDLGGASNQLPHRKKSCHKCHTEETQPGHQPELHCSESHGTLRSAEIRLAKLALCVAPGSLPVYKGFIIIINYLHVHGVCVGMCVPQYTRANQRTTSWSQFPPSSFEMDSKDQTRSQGLHGLYWLSHPASPSSPA